MNINELIILSDQLAHQSIDDRLNQVQRDDGYVSTTRNTVHAPSPLVNIGETLDELMCVPTDPPSLRVQVLAGKFWCRGQLWGWPGSTTTEDLSIELGVPTFAYIGITLDRNLNTMELFVEKTSGFMPFFHPDVFPVALIKLPIGATEIVEDYIVDLRPFLNFDISIPKDKIVLEMACLAPGESQMVDLGHFKGPRPLISVYTKVPDEGIAKVTHRFTSQSLLTRLEGANASAYYDPQFDAATLEPRIVADTIKMPATPNVLFVSVIRGTTNADGTKNFPFNNIPDAIDRLNGMDGYDTLFIEEGIYDLKWELNITKPVTFIGESATKAVIRMIVGRPRFGVAQEEITFRTVSFVWTKNVSEDTYLMETQKVCRFFNCVFRPETPQPSPQFLRNQTSRYISNCVMFNRFLNATALPPRIFTPKTAADLWVERIENNLIIGNWGQVFPTGDTIRNLIDLDPLATTVMLEDTLLFYPAKDSPCIDNGIATLVGADQDGTQTDIGLYGGQMASQVRITSYSVKDIAIFRYTPMTLFAPSLERFLNVTPIIGFSQQQANVRCAVSFDGGHTYVAWREPAGAWGIVNMDRFQEQANDPYDLAARLSAMGDIPTRGEIIIAWGIWTTDPKQTPIIRGMDFTVQSDGDAIRPLWPETLEMLISSDSLLITNRGDERLYGLVIVIY